LQFDAISTDIPSLQVAVAFWATETGCPLIGVCLSSLYVNAGPNLVVMKSTACVSGWCRCPWFESSGAPYRKIRFQTKIKVSLKIGTGARGGAVRADHNWVYQLGNGVPVALLRYKKMIITKKFSSNRTAQK
jgi:hypothetical protein